MEKSSRNRFRFVNFLAIEGQGNKKIIIQDSVEI